MGTTEARAEQPADGGETRPRVGSGCRNEIRQPEVQAEAWRLSAHEATVAARRRTPQPPGGTTHLTTKSPVRTARSTKLAVVRETVSCGIRRLLIELLQQARRQHDEGALSDARESVSAVADLSRRAEDPATLATTPADLPIRSSHNFAMMACVHERQRGGLARLGDADPIRFGTA